SEGRATDRLRVAIVQGGGSRGVRDSPGAARRTFEAHLAASARVPEGTDVVLWPEDVVDVDGPVEESARGRRLARLAEDLGAPVAAGVVEGGGDEFRNALVVWGPDGEVVARYDKVQRVPFGEYIPFRSVVERVADVGDVPRDATKGEGPGIVRLDAAGDLGVVISFEVFFARRARAAMRAGGEVLLAPTNASSYPTGQMPALELAAARIRALETGRDVLQAAPTGFSAFVDPDGDVDAVSDLGTPAVLEREVPRRQGSTPYTRLGDGPLVVGSAVALAVAWALARTRRGRLAR
ncbi:MAG: apolipoprotein N-acyltransferase, partial [Acidimicrobiia bacterium]|nr:apolipoprotein N-acyltransferase [Acidimicrobiia bacterium]